MPASAGGRWSVRVAFVLLILSWPLLAAASHFHAPEPWPSLDMPGFAFSRASTVPDFGVAAIHATTADGKQFDFTTATFFPFGIATAQTIENQYFAPNSRTKLPNGRVASVLGDIYPFNNFISPRVTPRLGYSPGVLAWLRTRLANLQPGEQFTSVTFEWHETSPPRVGATNPRVLGVSNATIELH